ncbi:MAG TPA: hypothetical protein VK724_10145 [Bryobacteraceae bacterium]|nr:hypothetical protein [Bryobacteraceae bacterium]
MRTLLWLLIAGPCFGNTSVVSVDTTQMQAKVTVRTDQAGFCTYRASRGSAFSSNVADLTDNGNTDARTGAMINGNVHVFVLGTRTAGDALAAAATYWVGVTCGTDAEVTATLVTRSIAWGNTAPDPVPFNAAKFGNMDYPVIDWTNQQTSYVDPVTGVEFWRVTGPGMMSESALSLAAGNAGILGVPLDASGTGKWASLANIGSNGASYSAGSGAPTDRAFIPLGNFACPAGTTFAGWYPKCTVDDLSFDVYCGNASASGVTITLQLSEDGGQTAVGNPVTTATCPTSTPVKLGTYPQLAANPPFLSWGFTPQHHLVVPPAGTVNAAGQTVSLQDATGTQNYFDTDWVSGTPLLINGTYYHVSSVSNSSAVTIRENPGTLANVPYVGAAFGVMVTKSNSAASASVSVGVNYAYATMPSACCNGDTAMMNHASVQVTMAANGSTSLSPALTGYLTNVVDSAGGAALLLWIPFNGDGSARAETRLLAMSSKPAASARLNTNGDSLPFGPTGISGYFFDNVDGTSAYTIDVNNRVWKLTYNEALTGCAGYVAFHPYPTYGNYNPNVAIADDCFEWTNLTPSAAGHDIQSQIVSAYQTGLNYLGQTVGPSHTGFALGWMNSPVVAGFDGGYFSASMDNVQNHIGVMASFDTTAGVLRSVRNSWNEGDCRWCGLHSAPVLTMGTWRFAVIDPQEDTGATNMVFPDSFKMNVTEVNRAGSGASAVWDCSGCSGGPQQSTSISGSEAHTCPASLLAPYQALSGTANCIQVKVSSPPCQQNPNATYTFPDGHTEKQEFPCSTPGFGTANANWSKLQDLQPGDWLLTNAGDQAENLVLLSVAYNSATDINLWLLRWAGTNYLYPLFGSKNDSSNSAHSSPWLLYMAPTYSTNAAALDASSPGNTWTKNNPLRFSSHGSAAPAGGAGAYSYQQTWFGGRYIGSVGTAVPNLLWTGMQSSASSWPTFAGSNNGASNSFAQSYNSGTYAPSAALPPFFVDYRHFNPSGGGAPEANGGDAFGTMSLTLVSGTSHTFHVAQDCCAAGPSDYKRLGLAGFAGRYLARDLSNPVTGNTGDLPSWSYCRAFNANECIQGSSVGNLYISLPMADLGSQCASSQFTQAIPCLYQPAPWSGQSIQFRIDLADFSGFTTRKFGYVHGHPGTAYVFSNCRPTADAQFMFCPGYWLDGVRTEWLAYKIPSAFPVDNVNRTSFVPVTVTYSGVPFASNIRARFGYLENGGDLLHCTAYAQDCSTEIPSASASDPFSFTNETVTRQSCANGAACTITIPSLPNRVLYYVVERIDGSGNVVTTTPLQAVTVP